MLDDKQLLITLKTDPDPGTVDLVSLDDGRVTGAPPTAVSAPQGTLTPFGFAVYPDGTAVITLAHSNQDGLFRNGAFTSVVDAEQAADCWMTRVGKYVFTANTGSKTISRLIGTGSHLFVDSQVAATIATGGAPADIDADAGVLGVIDHGAGQSHLSLFSYNEFGELTAQGTPITVDVADANGVAILSAGRPGSQLNGRTRGGRESTGLPVTAHERNMTIPTSRDRFVDVGLRSTTREEREDSLLDYYKPHPD